MKIFLTDSAFARAAQEHMDPILNAIREQRDAAYDGRATLEADNDTLRDQVMSAADTIEDLSGRLRAAEAKLAVRG